MKRILYIFLLELLIAYLGQTFVFAKQQDKAQLKDPCSVGCRKNPAKCDSDKVVREALSGALEETDNSIPSENSNTKSDQ